MTREPEGLDPTIQSREILFEADVQSVTPFLKLATVSHDGAAHKTFACDEGPSLGGLGWPRRRSCISAPPSPSDS
jgi:hypothetical protein